MIGFADLFTALDQTTKTTAKVDAMAAYFAATDAADAAWAVYFLCGRKPKQAVSGTQLRVWANELAGIPEWLFAESYDAVGDLPETISLLLPPPTTASENPLSHWVLRLLGLRDLPEDARKTAVLAAWSELDSGQRFIWNKLMTGGFRVGVSQLLVVRALSKVSGVPTATISHRLMGNWQPTPGFYESLLSGDETAAEASRPYPFFLAHPLEAAVDTLGDPTEWQAEWKWDGIRAQLLRRSGQTYLWSRGEELVTDRYPEVAAVAEYLPDGTALDGELLPWKNGGVLAFAELQKRIGRKTLGTKLLANVPVVLLVYDLIESAGEDWRERPLVERRQELERIVDRLAHPSLLPSPIVSFASWNALAETRKESRSRRVEGFMLKRKTSPYRVGRTRGDWWKWKIDPLTMDAVLTAAQKGHGKRASLYTDYTFSVWDDGKLVTVAKAYSGLTDAEIRTVDAFIRANTLDKFGPVRTVKPGLVFELGFEGVQASARHKSGIAVRFPRILRQRTDKSVAEADTLARVKRLLEPGPSA